VACRGVAWRGRVVQPCAHVRECSKSILIATHHPRFIFPCVQVFKRREKVWGWCLEKNLAAEHPVNHLIARLFKDDDRSTKELYESKLMLLLFMRAFCFHCVVCKLS